MFIMVLTVIAQIFFILCEFFDKNFDNYLVEFNFNNKLVKFFFPKCVNII